LRSRSAAAASPSQNALLSASVRSGIFRSVKEVIGGTASISSFMISPTVAPATTTSASSKAGSIKRVAAPTTILVNASMGRSQVSISNSWARASIDSAVGFSGTPQTIHPSPSVGCTDMPLSRSSSTSRFASRASSSESQSTSPTIHDSPSRISRRRLSRLPTCLASSCGSPSTSEKVRGIRSARQPIGPTNSRSSPSVNPSSGISQAL
jgi:hypothetical protein